MLNLPKYMGSLRSSMNYLSVCSGVEAATVAWHDLGWNPVAFSEIEKFPSEVLAHHYPDVPNLGDMSNYKEWNFGEKTIDLLVGGTPCQSFSVAGLRKGLEDPRGNLALIYCGILDKFRPKWFIWENVPGVLSSNKGRDFGSFLTAVGELGYGYGYRVLDAQNFGVPQRRRRVFVVGHLGDWRPAAEVLFESESLSWHPKKSKKARENAPGYIEGGFGAYNQSDVGGTTRASGGVLGGGSETFTIGALNTECGNSKLSHQTVNAGHFLSVYETHPSDSRVKEMGDTCQSVTARWGTGGGNIPFVLNKNYYDVITEVTVRKYKVDIPKLQTLLKKHKNISNQEIANKLDIKKTTVDHWFRSDSCFSIPDSKDWVLLKELLSINDDSFDESIMTFITKENNYDQSNRIYNGNKNSPTLTKVSAGNDIFALAENTIGRQPMNGGNGNGFTEKGPMYTLNATGVHGVNHNMAVRKLTPIECEKLQGFKPNYTNIKENCPDGPRYKAMGNSMAVPVMRWIAKRIEDRK